jgi:hypothetical protein
VSRRKDRTTHGPFRLLALRDVLQRRATTVAMRARLTWTSAHHAIWLMGTRCGSTTVDSTVHSSPSACFRFSERCAFLPRSCFRMRGALRSSRTLGAGCDGRVGLTRRASPTRTAKSCGPGLPTLRPSSRAYEARERQGQESPVSGESAYRAVKPLRREGRIAPTMPAVPSPCFFHARGLRLWRTPGLPGALCLQMRVGGLQSLDAKRLARRRTRVIPMD